MDTLIELLKILLKFKFKNLFVATTVVAVMLSALAAIFIFKNDYFIQLDVSKILLLGAVITIPAILTHLIIFLPVYILICRPFRILKNPNYILLEKHYPQYAKRFSNPLKWKMPYLIGASSFFVFISIVFIIIEYLTQGTTLDKSFNIVFRAYLSANGTLLLMGIVFRIITHFKNGRMIFDKLDKLVFNFL